jgi:hypothetical protein
MGHHQRFEHLIFDEDEKDLGDLGSRLVVV